MKGGDLPVRRAQTMCEQGRPINTGYEGRTRQPSCGAPQIGCTLVAPGHWGRSLATPVNRGEHMAAAVPATGCRLRWRRVGRSRCRPPRRRNDGVCSPPPGDARCRPPGDVTPSRAIAAFPPSLAAHKAQAAVQLAAALRVAVSPAEDRLGAHAHVRVAWVVKLHSLGDGLRRPVHLQRVPDIAAQRGIAHAPGGPGLTTVQGWGPGAIVVCARFWRRLVSR